MSLISHSSSQYRTRSTEGPGLKPHLLAGDPIFHYHTWSSLPEAPFLGGIDIIDINKLGILRELGKVLCPFCSFFCTDPRVVFPMLSEGSDLRQISVFRNPPTNRWVQVVSSRYDHSSWTPVGAGGSEPALHTAGKSPRHEDFIGTSIRSQGFSDWCFFLDEVWVNLLLTSQILNRRNLDDLRPCIVLWVYSLPRQFDQETSPFSTGSRPGKHTKSDIEDGPVEIVDLPIQRGDFSSSLCGCLPEGELSLQKLDLPADHPICERQVSGQEGELLLLQRLDVPADTF